MTHGSLFTGIGGFDLAAEIVGWKNIFSCEIDPFCNRVLKYHFPNETQYTDIRDTDFSVWRGRIDVLSGGFPCQPFSQAGKRKGTEDDRHLWPAMLGAIRQIQPRWVVGENVLGIVNWNGGMVFEQVCSDLENEGYKVQPFILPACGVNAPHRRYRTFFIAYSESAGDSGGPEEIFKTDGRQNRKVFSEPDEPSPIRQYVEDSNSNGWQDLERKEERRERQQRNVGSGDNERVCLSERDTTNPYDSRDRTPKSNSYDSRTQDFTDRKYTFTWTGGFGEITTDSQCGRRHEILKDVQPEKSDGQRIDGISSQRYAANAESQRRYGRCTQGNRTDGYPSERTYVFSRTSGLSRERTSSDPGSEQLQEWTSDYISSYQDKIETGLDCRVEQPYYFECATDDTFRGWWEEFPTVSPLCRGDDGFSDWLDPAAVFEGVKLSKRASAFGRWRTESVKAYGNAVVVPLIVQIFRAINQFEELPTESE